MKIQFDSQEHLIATTERLINIIAHERHWTKRWMSLFGFTNRKNMELWQSKADQIIGELTITEQDMQKRIEVVIKNPDLSTEVIKNASETKN